jgi:hypothetical protein
MPKCNACNEYFPPGFTEPVEGTKDNLCLFCKRDTKTLSHKGSTVTREQLVAEYQLALKMIKEKNEIIKNAARGGSPLILPASVRPD